ncbi:hypothetical protein [Dyella ginsengisoli]|uniref:hypothetical protein n=1 Tax=Dyella ginsengisoli TaxID=363848 RepID=UPI00034A757A|nr:hypothetical protein [Dyella ginsengisoli]
MNASKHPRYTQQALFDAKKAGVDYTFGFGTDNPLDLNIESHNFLLQGYWMNLATLRTVRRPLAAAIDTTPQVETLYHASKLVDLLWIEWDTQANEITGTWRADK